MTTKTDSTVTVGQAARLLGRSERFVQKLRAEGWISTAGRGRYPLGDLVRGAMAYQDAQIKKAGASAVTDRVTAARTREIELRIAEKERSLVPIEEAEAVTAEMASTVLRELQALPAQVTRDLELRAHVQIAVDRLIDRIAAYAAKRADELRTGEGDLFR